MGEWMQDPMIRKLLEALVVALVGIIGALGVVAVTAIKRWGQTQEDARRAHVADLAVAAVEQTAGRDRGSTKLQRALAIAEDMGVPLLPDELEAALKRAEGWYRDVRLPQPQLLEGND